MTAQQIINMARRLSYTNAAQIDDTTCLQYANIVYKELLASVDSDVAQDAYSRIFTYDIVAGQNKYDLPTANASQDGIGNILNVQVNYLTETGGASNVFTAHETRIFNLTNGGQNLAYYELNQPKEKPLYYVFDWSLYIYPTPLFSKTGGLTVHGTFIPRDMSLSDTPIIDPIYHQVIVLGIKKYLFSERGLYNEKQDATAEYERAKENMINTMNETTLSPVEKTFPSTNMYE